MLRTLWAPGIEQIYCRSVRTASRTRTPEITTAQQYLYRSIPNACPNGGGLRPPFRSFVRNLSLLGERRTARRPVLPADSATVGSTSIRARPSPVTPAPHRPARARPHPAWSRARLASSPAGRGRPARLSAGTNAQGAPTPGVRQVYVLVHPWLHSWGEGTVLICGGIPQTLYLFAQTKS